MKFMKSSHLETIVTFAVGEVYSIKPYSVSKGAEKAAHVPWAFLLPYFLIGIPIIILFVYFIYVSLRRYNKAKEKRRQRALSVAELTPEELEKLYGGDFPEEFASLDKMSREELRILAYKELEKQGRKPGEVDYLKGPLDWDDVDENFQPRPKVIRSDISKVELQRSQSGTKNEPRNQDVKDEEKKDTKDSDDKQNLPQ